MHFLPIILLLIATGTMVSATPPLTRRACGKVGSTRCHGNMIQKCNQYHVWELLHACPNPMTCTEPTKGFRFCGKKNETSPSPTSTTEALKPTASPQESCSVALSTRCGGQSKNTVQQCDYDNRWHFQHECASGQVYSFHYNRARCEWLNPGQSSLEERDEKRDLDTCGTAYATRCHNNNIEYCEPWDRQWHYQSLCWTHDHQRCIQYFLRAVCENWGKAESSLFIDGNDKLEVTPQEEKEVEKRDEKPGEEKVEEPEDCDVFYSTRCHKGEIQYCEPRDRQWRHQSDCSCKEHKVCRQEDRWNAACFVDFALCNGRSRKVGLD